MKKLTDFPDAHLRIFDRPAPPEPGSLRDVHLVGICGTGMGSLAGLMKEAGYAVRGSDQNVYPPMSTRLAEMDIPVAKGFSADNLRPAPDLVIVGNACTPTHPEAACAREQGLTQLSMPETLAHFFLNDATSLVVAGTHGKTTTTGMLAHVLRSAGLDPGFLVGGVMVNGNVSYAVGGGKRFVIEGDEYDSAYFDKRPKFMHYVPSSAIVTSMEFDHADIYSDWDDYRTAFEAFASTVAADGILVLCADEAPVRALAEHTRATVRTYGLDGDWDVTATDISPVEGGQQFTLIVGGKAEASIMLPMSGRHNLRNALAVSAISLHEGVSPQALADGFASFEGMKRRQEVRGEAAGVLVIDDFAHHPTAVRETTRAVRERWPSRRLVAVFEPRSNSSRRKLFEAPYGEAFDAAARVFISTPPFRHNDDPSRFMDTDAVVATIRARGAEASQHAGADDVLPALLDAVTPGDVVLIMSNGGFGNIHVRLLDALSQRAGASP